ncbi:MAG TPA: hypothetical protein VGH19_12260 [Verrucomicrobiae bacterium]
MNQLKSMFLRSLALLAFAGGLLFTQMSHAQVLLASYPLMAGQHEAAGFVVVSGDETNIYVRYTTSEGWSLKETHLAVEADFASIPQTGSGNVKIGRFEFGESLNGATTALYTIPRSGIGSLNFFVASHAVVERTSGSRETAWAGPLEFSGKNWATYFFVNGGSEEPPNR